MINKKAIFKSLIIISLLIVIIFAFIQIRNTLARYETTASTERDVDVAFWMIDTSFASERILISEIYPSDTPYEYTFTVSNFKDTKRAETDLEYEVILTTTTNLPFQYVIEKEDTLLRFHLLMPKEAVRIYRRDAAWSPLLPFQVLPPWRHFFARAS